MLMLTPLLIANIVLSQADTLTVRNLVATYGQLGPVRQDLRFLPGDVLHFRFDIAGLKNDEAGRMRYVIHVQLVGPGNKVIVQQRLPEMIQVRVFGGAVVRQALHISLPEDSPAGDYRLQVRAEDSQNPAALQVSAMLPFKITAREFGIVQFQLYSIYTPQVQLPCPAVGVVGQTLYVTAVVLRGKKAKLDETWNLDVEMRLLDEQGKTLPDSFPVKGQFRKVPGDLDFLDVRFDLPVQKAGKFLISIQASEPGTTRRASLLVPFRAVDWNNELSPAK